MLHPDPPSPPSLLQQTWPGRPQPGGTSGGASVGPSAELSSGASVDTSAVPSTPESPGGPFVSGDTSAIVESWPTTSGVASGVVASDAASSTPPSPVVKTPKSAVHAVAETAAPMDSPTIAAARNPPQVIDVPSRFLD
jgi:hypothetical protein